MTTRAAGIQESCPGVSETGSREEATGESKAEGKKPIKHFETVKQSSYKDLMESGDVYSIFGADEEFVPNSDDES